MSIQVLKAGLSDSIQDGGRYGYAKHGVNHSGAMDKTAMMAANALAGNELQTAVLEMYFPAATLLLEKDVLLAISGADFGATINCPDGSVLPLPINKTAWIKAGATLSFSQKNNGQYCYLAVRSGFKLTAWMGSYSTQFTIAKGGFEGRKLKKADRLAYNEEAEINLGASTVFPWLAPAHRWYAASNDLGIITGPEWNWMEPLSQKHFLSHGFTLSAQSNRMGIRLEGLPLSKNDDTEMISSGTSFGSIQLLPSGQMIILAADHPTTGGYPRIANIISAHLPSLAQLPAGSTVHFVNTGMAEAEKMYCDQQKELAQLQMAVKLRLLAL